MLDQEDALERECVPTEGTKDENARKRGGQLGATVGVVRRAANVGRDDYDGGQRRRTTGCLTAIADRRCRCLLWLVGRTPSPFVARVSATTQVPSTHRHRHRVAARLSSIPPRYRDTAGYIRRRIKYSPIRRPRPNRFGRSPTRWSLPPPPAAPSPLSPPPSSAVGHLKRDGGLSRVALIYPTSLLFGRLCSRTTRIDRPPPRRRPSPPYLSVVFFPPLGPSSSSSAAFELYRSPHRRHAPKLGRSLSPPAAQLW